LIFISWILCCEVLTYITRYFGAKLSFGVGLLCIQMIIKTMLFSLLLNDYHEMYNGMNNGHLLPKLISLLWGLHCVTVSSLLYRRDWQLDASKYFFRHLWLLWLSLHNFVSCNSYWWWILVHRSPLYIASWWGFEAGCLWHMCYL